MAFFTNHIQVNSGIKLEQQGLELSNLGIASFYINKKADLDIANYFTSAVKKIRGIYGLTLQLHEMRALDTSFIFNRKDTDNYSGSIFEHNAKLARELKIAPSLGTLHILPLIVQKGKHLNGMLLLLLY